MRQANLECGGELRGDTNRTHLSLVENLMSQKPLYRAELHRAGNPAPADPKPTEADRPLGII
jgi:hypothetical protein